MYYDTIVIEEKDGSRHSCAISIASVLIVGYSGRDSKKTMDHIRELEKIGVAPPPSIPMVYPLGSELLTTQSSIVVGSDTTSGEVEYVLFHYENEWLVTVGSDHTDREIEKWDVPLAKRSCPKVFSNLFWKVQDVEAHWDQMVLRSWVTTDGNRLKYQEHDLSALLTPKELLSKLNALGYSQMEQTLIFSGTVPTLSGFVYGDSIEIELSDPTVGRSITQRYEIISKTAQRE